MSSSNKVCDFVDNASNYQLLKKECATTFFMNEDRIIRRISDIFLSRVSEIRCRAVLQE
jgi:hypothetical protein